MKKSSPLTTFTKMRHPSGLLKLIGGFERSGRICSVFGLLLLWQQVELSQLGHSAEFERSRTPINIAQTTVLDRETSIICHAESERSMSPFARFITKALTGKEHSRRCRHTKTSIAAQVGSLEDRVLLTLDANGWTELKPSADSRLIYVSSSIGNDANDGLSEGTPKQTLAAGKALLRDFYPDWLLLKCGDTFPTQQFGLSKRGRSESEPQVISSYGTGERPILSEVKFAYGGPSGFTLSDVWIVNLEFRGNVIGNPGNSNNGAAFFMLQSTNRILIEGCLISGYLDGLSIQQSPTWGQPNGNMTIRRNVVQNNIHQGLLLTYQDTTLVEENVFDRNGYGADGASPSILTHNVYFSHLKNLTVRNNIFARASNFGTKLSSDTPGSLTNFVIDNNLYYDNGLSLDHSAGSSGDVNTTFTHEQGIIESNIFTELNKVSGVQQDLAAYVLNTKNVLWSENTFVHKSVYLGNPLLVWGEHHEDITVQGTVIYDWNKGANPGSFHLETDSSRIDGYSLINNEIDLPAASYVDPSRSVGSYYATIGGANDPIAFLSAAKSLSKANWNPKFTADAVNDYIRAGFVRVLATPVFSTPNTTTTSDPLQTVSWNTIDGADAYEVWYSNLTTGQNPALKATAATASYTPATALPIGQYQIWVRATQDGGPASSWSSLITMRVSTPPTLHTLPKNGTDARPKLTWTPVPGAVRYEVWGDNLTTGAKRVVNAQDITETSFTPDSDLGFSEFRFWVRGFDVKGLSAEWSVAQDYSRVGITTAVQPVVFDGLNSVPPIAWNEIAGAARYELWANNLTTGENAIIRNAEIPGASFVPTQSLPFGTNRFWVRAFDADGRTTKWSDTLDAVNTPALLTPVAPTFERRPTFTWAALPGMNSSEVYLSINGTVINPKGILGTSWTPTSDLPVGELKWWVRSSAANGVLGPWSARAESFIGGRSAVLAAGVPGNDAARIGVFAWQAVTGASRYILHVERIGVGVVILESNLTGTSYTTSAPLAAGQYRAWVKAIDGGDNVTGIWPTAFAFTVVRVHVEDPNSPVVPQFAVRQLESVLSDKRLTAVKEIVMSEPAVASQQVVRSNALPADWEADRHGDINTESIGDWTQPKMSGDALMSELDADLIDMVMSNIHPIAVAT